MIINLKSETNLSGIYVVYEGSTNLETPGIRGISHLMEHLMCKTFFDMISDFDRDGIDWNAYTSSNEIVFYLTGLDEEVQKHKMNFLNSLQNFNISKEQFENERNIVLQEYEDCFNDQSSSHSLNLSRKLFNDFDPIGSKDDLENLKFIDCLNFYELQYQNPTKIINVSSKNTLKNPGLNFSEREIDKRIEYGNNKVSLELGNGFKDKTSIMCLSPIIESGNNKVHFLNSMLSLGLKSPLYDEVREKRGLVYYINCFQSRMNKQGITTISTQTSNRNFDQVIDAIGTVLKNPNKFLTKERFQLVKDYYTVRKKKDKILRYKNVSQWISPTDWNIYDILDTVKISDIRDIYEEYYDFDKFYISNDKKEFLR